MSAYEDLRAYFSETVFRDDESKTLSVALDKAYADMSRRASGHTESIKAACKGWLEETFEKLPDESKQPGFDYDVWHEETCGAFVEKMNGVKAGFGSVGRAQKVINMAVKYLSCISEAYDGVLPYCHMTLDSYTLAWYKEKVMPWVKEQGREDVERLTEWSKLGYGDYRIIQTNIRDYLKTSPVYSIKIGGKETSPIQLSACPFEAEFVVWEGEIVKRKYDLLVGELLKYAEGDGRSPAGREKDGWLVGGLFDDFLRSYSEKRI